MAACLGFQRWMMMGNVKRAPLWTPAVGSLWVSASDACQVPFGPLPRSLKGTWEKTWKHDTHQQDCGHQFTTCWPPPPRLNPERKMSVCD